MNHSLLRTEELDYDLPDELIATRPVQPRDHARMLVVRKSSDAFEHYRVLDLPAFLNSHDALVFNTTSVVPARIVGLRVDTQGRIDGLYLRDETGENGRLRWRVLLKAGRKLKVGHRISFLNSESCKPQFEIVLEKREDDEWVVEVIGESDSIAALNKVGRTPLPPYIQRARGSAEFEDRVDRQWYQTVYADPSQCGSIAAPTAGFHFTDELLASIEAKGVSRLQVTLHVGLGTFKPIVTERVQDHKMHVEWFEVPDVTVNAISKLKENPDRRILGVGSTSVRTLESLPAPLPCRDFCGPLTGTTDLMIVPPYEFRVVDGMLTNFHLPRTTLLALVGAMIGLDKLKAAYQEAIRNRYRFYSYGDAMLILP